MVRLDEEYIEKEFDIFFKGITSIVTTLEIKKPEYTIAHLYATIQKINETIESKKIKIKTDPVAMMLVHKEIIEELWQKKIPKEDVSYFG